MKFPINGLRPPLKKMENIAEIINFNRIIH